MPIMPPHDPQEHEHKEPEGAGVRWWTVQAAKIGALVALHGEMLNGNEAARFLGVSRQRVAEIADNGVIRRFVAGRHTFYPLADLRAFDQRRKEPVTGTRGRGKRAQPVFSEPSVEALS